MGYDLKRRRYDEKADHSCAGHGYGPVSRRLWRGAGSNSASNSGSNSQSGTQEGALKVALCMSGAVNDQGWNQSAYDGAKAPATSTATSWPTPRT